MFNRIKAYLIITLCLFNSFWSIANPDTTKIITDYQHALIENHWHIAVELAFQISPHETESELHKSMDTLAGLDEVSRFWIDYRLAEIEYKEKNHPLLARNHIKDALIHANNLSETEMSKASLYLLTSDIYEELSQYDSSYYFLTRLKNLAKKNDISESTVFQREGNLQNRLFNYDSAILAYSHAIELARLEKDTIMMSNSYHGIAYAQRKLGQIDSSAFYEYQSLRLSEQVNYKRGEALALQSLAILAYLQKEYDKSNQLARRLVENKNNAGEQSILANTYNLLGVNYGILGKYDSALHYHDKSLEIKYELGNQRLIASSLNNIASIYLRKNLPDTAIKYLLKSKPVFEEAKDTANLATLFSNVGSVYFKKGDLRQSRSYYLKSQDFAQKANAYQEHIIALSGLVMVDSTSGDYKNALRHQSRMMNVKEELLNIQKQAEIEKYREEFETEKKEIALEKSQQELIHERKINQSKTRMIYFAIGIALILALLSITLWYFYRLNKNLRYRNELLLKEQNHRIKNNLQMITNLLSLQSNTISSNEGKAALEESQLRIKSVSLLHRLLYDQDQLREVYLSDYLTKLGNEIKATSPRDFTIDYYVSTNLKLPIEKLLSLGILINELIMNSVKHVDNLIPLKIEIQVSHEPQFTLRFKDNGQGVSPEDWNNTQSFGNRLIKIQSAQLHGRYAIRAGDGFDFSLLVS